MSETRWFDRARIQYTLRAGSGTSRVLMSRYCDEDGFDHDGSEVPWRDVATIASYNDADIILRHLRIGSDAEKAAASPAFFSMSPRP